MKVVRRLRYTRTLRSRKGLWLIRLDKMDKKNNSDKDYDGDDKHSVTNDNPAQERADIKELRALKKTQATRKSIGHLCSKKLLIFFLTLPTTSVLDFQQGESYLMILTF